MLLKVYRSGIERLVAVCDTDLLGKSLSEGELVLSVTDFYRGEPASDEEIRAALRSATIANLVGERSVGLAVEEGLVDPDCVIRIEGVPHAQMIRMR